MKMLSRTSVKFMTLLVLFAPVHAQDANETALDEIIDIDCTQFDSCLTCMDMENNQGCFWTTANECISNCSDITDRHVGCYAHFATASSSINSDGELFASEFFTTAENLCAAQEEDQANLDTCADITDCTECMETTDLPRSHGETNLGFGCNWFQSSSYCGYLSLDPDGLEPDFYCPDTPDGICYFGGTDCTSCLEARPYGVENEDENNTCTWVGDVCSLDCWNSEPELYCYSPNEYPNATSLSEICDASSVFFGDQTLCDNIMSNCEECLATTKSDGSPCFWDGWSCGSRDFGSAIDACGVNTTDGTGLAITDAEPEPEVNEPEADTNANSTDAATESPTESDAASTTAPTEEEGTNVSQDNIIDEATSGSQVLLASFLVQLLVLSIIGLI